jgi:hypothetical protein
VDSYILDFIEVIRIHTSPDPSDFLLSIRRYLPRFLFAVGLRVAFNIDWRDVVTDALDLNKRPQPATMSGLFANKYLRNLLYAYCVWKLFREPWDADYEKGTNDILTLLDKYATLKTALTRGELEVLFTALSSLLPSYSLDIRKRAWYMIDTAQDAYHLRFLNFNEPMYRKTQG